MTTTPNTEPELQAETPPECDHHWSSHHRHGIHITLCTICHEPKWDELLELHNRANAFTVLLGGVGDIVKFVDGDPLKAEQLADLLFANGVTK